MEVEQMIVGHMAVFCYLVSCLETKEALIIDPGGNEEQLADEEAEPVVSVNLDAASPFNAMLINLKILMGEEENVTVSLDYPHEEELTTDDPEAQDVIDRLNKKG